MIRRMVQILAVLLFVSTAVSAKTWIVDQNGLGDYTTIMAAINVAKPGDVVKVHPGIYEEKVIIAKEIIVEGSGAESTMISNQTIDFAVEISVGKIRWFSITSQGSGVNAKGGVFTNCVITKCKSSGIRAYTNSKIINCVIIDNFAGLHIMPDQNPIISNTICISNFETGFGVYSHASVYNVQYCLSFNNKYNFWKYYERGVVKSTGSLEADPQFQPGSYQISAGSPCRDAGNPAYQDPDGTRADMGYYGGPDAPTFPVMRQSLIKLNEDGTIQLEAIGISPY